MWLCIVEVGVGMGNTVLIVVWWRGSMYLIWEIFLMTKLDDRILMFVVNCVISIFICL